MVKYKSYLIIHFNPIQDRIIGKRLGQTFCSSLSDNVALSFNHQSMFFEISQMYILNIQAFVPVFPSQVRSRSNCKLQLEITLPIKKTYKFYNCKTIWVK